METYIYTYGTQKFEIERYKAEEMDLLKERIRNGLIKLDAAFHTLAQATDIGPEKWADWKLATLKLRVLCDNLSDLGYKDCLFLMPNGGRTKKCLEGINCLVCPSNKEYWVDEMFPPKQPKLVL